MRIPNEQHLARDLRIHEIVADFTLEDVWLLPGVEGTLADFDVAVQMSLDVDPVGSSEGVAKLLWEVREFLGRRFGLGDVTDPTGTDPGGVVPGTGERNLRGRLPADLRGTVEGLRYTHVPFVPLYRTATEWAAEVSNATVHGVLHLSWLPKEGSADTYQCFMAIYVKPRGWFGHAYMAFIKPFRYLIVYPALERQVAREWSERAGAR